VKIFVLYRLRQDVSFAEYRRWSLEADQPTLRSLAQVGCFNVYATEPAPDAVGDYSVVEVIEVDDLEAWKSLAATDAVEKLRPDFERFVDTVSLCILYGEEIDA
jgi:hypothetical protein